VLHDAAQLLAGEHAVDDLVEHLALEHLHDRSLERGALERALHERVHLGLGASGDAGLLAFAARRRGVDHPRGELPRRRRGWQPPRASERTADRAAHSGSERQRGGRRAERDPARGDVGVGQEGPP